MDRAVLVFNRSTIQTANPTDDHIVIQITDTRDTEFPPLSTEAKDSRKGILQLRFEDMDNSPGMYGTAVAFDYVLFSEEHAKQILDFVFKEHAQVPVILVHCEGGISRSPAVAAALTKIMGGDDSPLFQIHMPNRRVYSILLKTWEERNNGSP